ncbi:unnamed protein product [Victoria cruziana]
MSSASREARCFSFQELDLATKNFNDINFIGQELVEERQFALMVMETFGENHVVAARMVSHPPLWCLNPFHCASLHSMLNT